MTRKEFLSYFAAATETRSAPDASREDAESTSTDDGNRSSDDE